MRSSLGAGLIYIGTILFSFGLAISVLKLLNALYGEPNEMGGLMGAALLGIGFGAVVSGYLLRRTPQAPM